MSGDTLLPKYIRHLPSLVCNPSTYKGGEILCIIVILRGTKMEIDNWQTMMLIFEVVGRIFKKQGGKYGTVYSEIIWFNL